MHRPELVRAPSVLELGVPRLPRRLRKPLHRAGGRRRTGVHQQPRRGGGVAGGPDALLRAQPGDAHLQGAAHTAVQAARVPAAHAHGRHHVRLHVERGTAGRGGAHSHLRSGRWRRRGGWDLAAYRCDEGRWTPSAVALCGGETLMSYHRRLRVLAPGPDGGGGGGGGGRSFTRLVEVAAALTEPSLALLGLPPDTSRDYGGRYWNLVAHRGAVYGVKAAPMGHNVQAMMHGAELLPVVSVWRLARQRLQWEGVARMDVTELERLTGLESVEWYVRGAWGVGDLLGFTVHVHAGSSRADGMRFLLGLRLGTAPQWEVIQDKQGLFCGRVSRVDQLQEIQVPETVYRERDDGVWEFVGTNHVSMPFELRPDLFL